jgi:hypothetical protein
VHLRHAQDPSNAARQWGGYYALAQHFGAALGRVFGDPDKGHPRVIILEDDLEIAVRGRAADAAAGAEAAAAGSGGSSGGVGGGAASRAPSIAAEAAAPPLCNRRILPQRTRPRYHLPHRHPAPYVASIVHPLPRHSLAPYPFTPSRPTSPLPLAPLLQPDFFDYFSAVEPILDGDRSLLAASAWADIGQPQFVADPARVYRSDFFPGLGWMLTKHVRSAAAALWQQRGH